VYVCNSPDETKAIMIAIIHKALLLCSKVVTSSKIN
jgi:hypothetical protein